VAKVETTSSGGWRAALQQWIESPAVSRFITGLILVNAVTLGLETSDTVREHVGGAIKALDVAILTVFVIELTAKLVAYGWRFFLSGWNVFDLAVVGIALAPVGEALSVLRALRVLRVLRLLSIVPDLRRVVEALLRSLPGLGAIAGLLMLIFYVFAVMATMMFGDRNEEAFGTLGRSLFTLFQIMTLEGWADIARKIMEEMPLAWAFFVPFILVTTLTVLNLFVAIIVNSMQTLHDEDMKRDSAVADQQHVELVREIRALRAEMEQLRSRPSVT
jgi:voltage-gated sodium channel